MFYRLFNLIILLYIILTPQFRAYSEDESGSQEYLVKAAFLYNFAKFVQWPDSAFKGVDDPIVLCILGNHPFGSSLETIENKEIRQRHLFIKFSRSLKELEGCHILFISSSEAGNLPLILSQIKDRPLLTVADTEGFSNRGIMINLINADNKVRFEINLDAINRASLKVSAQLLKLAITIINSSPPQE